MSENSDERSPGFNKSLIGKLVTAGAFVLMGTGAVGYYIHRDHAAKSGGDVAQADLSPDVQANATDVDGGPDANSPESGDNESQVLPPSNVASSKAAAVSDAAIAQNASAQTKTEFRPKEKEAAESVPSISRSLKPAASQQTSPNETLPTIPNRARVADSNANEFASPRKSTSGTFKPTASNSRQANDYTDQSFSAPKVAKTASDFSPKSKTFSPNTSSPIPTPETSFRTEQKSPSTASATNGFAPKQYQPTTASAQTRNSAPASGSGSAAKPQVDISNNSLRGKIAAFDPTPRRQQGNPTTAEVFTPNLPNGTRGVPPASVDAANRLKRFSPEPQNSSASTGSTLPPITNRAAQTNRPRDTAQNRVQRSATGSNLQNVSTPRTRRSIGQPANSPIKNRPGDRVLEGLQAPSLTIEKIAPREIQVNKVSDFQLVVKNVGRVAAEQVNVVDQIPAGTELVSAVPQPQRGQGGIVSWQLDRIEPGQEKQIKIQLKPLTPGEIGSVAQVTFATMASMRTKVTKPVLSITHSTKPSVLIGDAVMLDITLKNEGDGPATKVVIQEDLPAGLAFSEGFRELEYAVGTLGPGQSRNIRLELKAAKIGKYRNVILAHADGGLRAQHAVDLEVTAPSLQASGDGPTRRYLKREASHRFTVRNTGTAAATNVELVCRLPSGLRYISANNRGKYDENAHAVFWSLAELNPGLVANVELTTNPVEPGNQDLKFEVVSDLEQTAEAVCKLNVEHLVDVFFDIDDVVDPIEIGSDTSYRIRITNQGTKTAANVRLGVDFPPGIQPTSVDGNIANEIRGQQIAFQPITTLNPGDQIEIIVHGKGISAGDHRVSVNLSTDDREVNVSKQESTRVYSDR